VRPAVRGPHPVDATGQPKVFREYREALDDLVKTLGRYCAYCERPVSHSPEVEHVRPKSLNRSLLLRWSNLLVSCRNCNAHKRAKRVRLRDYYWPDRDNTFRAFAYGPGGALGVSCHLTQKQTQRAQRTIDLTRLDHPTTDKDWRTLLRAEAWDAAQLDLARLKCCDTPEFRALIADRAADKGHFPIWMTVFRDDADMCRRFIEAFRGTAPDCFDAGGNPIPRPGGDL